MILAGVRQLVRFAELKVSVWRAFPSVSAGNEPHPLIATVGTLVSAVFPSEWRDAHRGGGYGRAARNRRVRRRRPIDSVSVALLKPSV